MKILIVGVGLIRGSFALRDHGLAGEILGADTSAAHAEQALRRGLGDCIASIEQEWRKPG